MISYNKELVGFYKNMRSTKCWQVGVTDILSGIKNGNWADQINRYRQSGDGTIKENLPCFTVGGVFSPTKHVDNLVSYSGLLSLDIDDVDISSLDLVSIYSFKSLFSLFRSAGNNGYCALIKTIPLTSVDQFKRLYQGVYEELFPILGGSCKFDHLPNLNRLRYVSFDTALVINKDCSQWSIEREVPNLIEVPVPKSDRKVSINLGQLNDQEKIDLTLSKFEEVSGRFGEKGTRHQFILDFARWCCRANISESFVRDFCLINYHNPSREVIWRQEVVKCIRDSYKTYATEMGNYEPTKKFNYEDILSSSSTEQIREQIFLLIADKINYRDRLVSEGKPTVFIEKEIKFFKKLQNYV